MEPFSSATAKRPLPRADFTSPFIKVWRYLRLALQIWTERRQLAQLGDRELRDIGLAGGEARAEAERSFWDLPPSRVERLRLR